MQTVDYAAGQFEDEGSLAGVMELFEQWNPGLRLGWSRQRGESEWRQERGSRVCWIQQGAGEVWVPAGYRTKEGDGDPLPRCYHPEAAPREWVEAVRRATARAACFKGNVRAALERIASRLRGEYYLGDAANELWTWIQYGGQAPDAEFASFIDLFRRVYDRVGFR